MYVLAWHDNEKRIPDGYFLSLDSSEQAKLACWIWIIQAWHWKSHSHSICWIYNGNEEWIN